MSTSVIEPGTRLAGRYRLDDRVSEAGGSTFWKATDEILARPVAVLTFAPGFPRVHDVVTAARAASRLTDPRLTQVFDADDSGERAYVVSEWVTGETLEDLLAEGPMEPGRAAAFLLEVAEALTSAHSAGLAHLCLTPHNLVWTSGGTVKVTGLGVEAVLSGMTSDTPAIDDTRGLGELLYAALTGHWCGAEGTQLPTAPVGSDGRPLPPGQVRARVPHDLDAIVCRALHISLRGSQEPLSAPSAFAGALALVPRSPLPFVPLTGSTPPAVVPRDDDAHTATSSPMDPLSRTVPDASPSTRTHSPARSGSRATSRPGPVTTSPARHAGGGGGSLSRPAIAAIVVGVLVLVAIGAWGLSQLGGNDGGSNPNKKAGTPTTPPAKPASHQLDPVGALPFRTDSTGSRDTRKAIDGSKATFWATQHFNDADFGRLRKGEGLTIDLGKQEAVDKVSVVMPAGTPGKVELHVGDSGDPLSNSQVASGDAVGAFDLNAKHAKGQYVTLWFTKLPQVGSLFIVKVNDVALYGSG